MEPEHLLKLLEENRLDLETIGACIPSREELREAMPRDVVKMLEILKNALEEGNPASAIRIALLDSGSDVVIVATFVDPDAGDAVVLAKAGDRIYAWRC